MLRIHRHFGYGALGLVLMVLGLTGCNDPQAPAATALRQRRVQATLNVIAGREADSARRMQRTLNSVELSARRHAAQHRDNRVRRADWAQRERQRWQDHQPLYRRRIADLFAGDSDTMKRSFRAMFY